MSRKQSAYHARMREERLNAQEATRKTWEQYYFDTAIITLNRLGLGEKRIREFIKAWGVVYDEFFDALRYQAAESDYQRVRLDEAIKPLCTEQPFIPFEKRYEFLPDIKY